MNTPNEKTDRSCSIFVHVIGILSMQNQVELTMTFVQKNLVNHDSAYVANHRSCTLSMSLNPTQILSN